MRAPIVLVIVCVAVLDVCAGRVFDEKGSAIKEIEAKLKEATVARDNILTAVQAERKNLNGSAEGDLVKHLKTKTNETRNHLEEEVTAAIRTAIVKAKPISVIHCIRSTASAASEDIDELFRTMTTAVVGIKNEKVKKINLDEFSANAIIKGLTDLVNQAKNKISSGGDIQKVKKEALANCESAIILLADIEIHVHEPILNMAYIKMRQTVDKTYRDFKAALEKKLQTCVQ